tara:strand:- start:1501 stop:2586 length:1086 start_codon:yes stop_codon:yes gene_type:complete
MNELKVLRRAEGGTTSGSQFVAPTIGNISQAGRDSVSQARIQDLLSRFKASDVPDRYADGGDILSPQDEMQDEYDAEVAAMSSGSASGLGSFFEDLLYGGQDPSDFSEMDLRPEFIRDMPEIPEEVEIAMSIVGPGKGKGFGKGIGSLIDQAGDLKGLGKKLTDSMRDRQPSLPSPKRGRDYDEEPMSGREFLGFPKDSRQDNMARMNELLRNPKADIILDEKMGVPKSQIDDLARRSSRSGADTQLDRLRIKKDSLEGQLMQDRLEPRTRRRLESELRDVLRDMNFFGPEKLAAGGRPGLYANINAKRKRIAAGSGEKMRKPGSKGAPTAANFKQAAKTAKLADGGNLMMRKGYYGKSYK